MDNKVSEHNGFIKDTLPKIFFILQIIVGIVASFWILYNHQPYTGDDVEHLHSAWLVHQGKVPYLDFFQHHNFLLWYLFAPLVGFFAYDIVIFDIVRIISTLVMFLTLFVSAKIVQRFICHSKYAGLLAIASIFPSFVVLSGQDFRPDNYMVASFIIGLYFFFAYLETHKKISLITSFAMMFVTFMFMQKSLFFLAIFGVIVLYLLCKKQIAVKDFLSALILPLIGVILVLSWLAYHGIVERYWLSNFIFNLYIPDVYDYQVEPTTRDFYVLSAIAFGGFIYFMIKGNIYARIVGILWLSELLQRLFYFSLNRHYYYFLDILNAIMAGAIIWVIIKKIPWSAYLFVALSFAALWGVDDYQWDAIHSWGFRNYCKYRELEPPYHRYVTPKYVLEQTNKCDSVLNGYGLTYGIFTKDITYYWNLNGQLDVIGNKIGLAPLPDLNAAVEKHLPKIIYTGPYWDEKMNKRNKQVLVHMIKPEIRDKYYQQSLFVNMFILKEKYQKERRCRYDFKTDTWNYYVY